MKLTIDTQVARLTVEDNGSLRELPLHSREAFELMSDQWLRIGWGQRYSYTFTWLGRPIVQLSEDLLRIQEVIADVQPDVIIETGVAHGGSLIFYATLCHALGKGRVVGVDVEIRPKNREAIEGHRLGSYITLIEGSSVAPGVVQQVRALIRPGERVMIVLDSDHSKAHVLEELVAYHPFVSPGSYIVATDGIMKDLSDVPGGRASWLHDNPTAAAREFAAAHPEFAHEAPAWRFNESSLRSSLTYWPDAWLKRR